MTKINTIKNIIKPVFYEIKSNHYSIIDFSTKNQIGELMVSPRKDELFINSLVIKKEYRRKGIGHLCLDFAEALSRKMGFNGRLRCVAGLTPYDMENPPHIFYRKYGFTTDDKKALEEIDKAIIKNKQITGTLSLLKYMYYPEK